MVGMARIELATSTMSTKRPE